MCCFTVTNFYVSHWNLICNRHGGQESRRATLLLSPWLLMGTLTGRRSITGSCVKMWRWWGQGGRCGGGIVSFVRAEIRMMYYFWIGPTWKWPIWKVTWQETEPARIARPKPSPCSFCLWPYMLIVVLQFCWILGFAIFINFFFLFVLNITCAYGQLKGKQFSIIIYDYGLLGKKWVWIHMDIANSDPHYIFSSVNLTYISF